MPNQWSGVTIDCQDAERVADFWSALLDRPRGPMEDGFIYLGVRDDAQPWIVFQAVPEPKRGKVRIHLDVTVDDIEAGIDEVLALGGSSLDTRFEYAEGVVVTVSDPEGHEFCLVQYY